MNLDDILRIACEAGAELYADTLLVNGKDAHDFIKRFAALVAAAEREECAKVCEAWAKDHATAASSPVDECTYENCDFVAAASDCASAIRARENKS